MSMIKGHELIETSENQFRCLKCNYTFFRQPFRDLNDIPPCKMEVG